MNASLVDTVKAGEPIATVVLTLLFLPGEKVTLPIFLSLLPIVAGVAVSSMSDASFQLLGLAMAMGKAALPKGPSLHGTPGGTDTRGRLGRAEHGRMAWLGRGPAPL